MSDTNGANGKEVARRSPRRDFTEAEVTTALFTLAYFNGSAVHATRALAKDGIEVKRTTLQSWKDKTYTDRYLEAQKQVRDRVWAMQSDQWRQVSEQGAAVSLDAIAEAKKAIKQKDSKMANEYASAARNLTTSAGISNDKAAVIDGRPVDPGDRKDASELIRSLASRFGGLITVDAVRVGIEVSPGQPDASLEADGHEV